MSNKDYDKPTRIHKIIGNDQKLKSRIGWFQNIIRENLKNQALLKTKIIIYNNYPMPNEKEYPLMEYPRWETVVEKLKK